MAVHRQDQLVVRSQHYVQTLQSNDEVDSGKTFEDCKATINKEQNQYKVFKNQIIKTEHSQKTSKPYAQ
jgi:hypothetical protein